VAPAATYSPDAVKALATCISSEIDILIGPDRQGRNDE
jgi:hypothetical protein